MLSDEFGYHVKMALATIAVVICIFFVFMLIFDTIF
jgi:hypothetical protein